jgi:molybdopterin converting factor small subunit
MVEIKFGEQFEVSDLAGRTVSEAREQFKSEFGIPDKAKARLNGGKVKASAELDTVLNDDDRLTFAVSRGSGIYLIGALLLALAVTGGVFAFGWVNDTTDIDATISNYNFADVEESNNVTGWSGHGNFKGDISAGTLFNVNPAPGYSGDLVVSVGLGNAADLSEQYRVLSLQLEMVYTANASVIDISAGNGAEWVLLNLKNGSVDMFPENPTANMTIRVKDGFYITQAKGTGAWGGSADPELFCEVAQR